jgi:hypothetical protein
VVSFWRSDWYCSFLVSFEEIPKVIGNSSFTIPWNDSSTTKLRGFSASRETSLPLQEQVLSPKRDLQVTVGVGEVRRGCRWATGSGFQKVFFGHPIKVAEKENPTQK